MPIRKVLLVGTDETVGASLQLAGWELHCAADCDTGLRLAQAEKPDAVVLDGEALGAIVAALVSQLRAGKATARAAVIVLVPPGAAPVADVAGTLTKPIDAPTLPRQVRELFEEHRFHAQLARLDDLGGASFVAEMIDLFLQTAPQRLEEAHRGAAANDWVAVARAVHPLKSSAGNLGADAVQRLAEQVEHLAGEGQAEPVPPLLGELDQAFAAIKARLECVRRAGS